MFRSFYTVFAGENQWPEFFKTFKVLLSRGSSGFLVSRFETSFASFVGRRHATAFGSGRMALFAILKALDITSEDEVVLQAFTCNVVPRVIKETGATPVYVDIDPRTFNMDMDLLEAAVTERTRAVIVQHTFGITPDSDRLRDILAGRNIAVIEDCAHAFRPLPNGALGNTNGFAFFSTDHTKPLNTHVGGVACCNSKEHSKRIIELASEAKSLNFLQEKKLQISFLLEFMTHRPSLYSIMRFPMAILIRCGFFFTWSDHHAINGAGKDSGIYRMTDFQAMLGLSQLEQVQDNISHRKAVFSILEEKFGWFQEENIAPLLRYAMCVQNQEEFHNSMPATLSQSIWFESPVSGGSAVFADTDYAIGKCPVAEKVCLSVVNIPINRKIPISVYQKLKSIRTMDVASLQQNVCVIRQYD